ncbi:MAG: recombinase family protein [archaeon]|nr:recombinase family protein [archaeon]
MIYAYTRVSTQTQTPENQMLEIKKYCKKLKITDIKFISETISGTKKIEKRELGKLISILKKDDVVIITELSRLGRSMIMILSILQTFQEKKVKLIAIKEGFELGDNIQSKVIAFAFGLCAEIERTLISERTKQGLERVKREGKHIGRSKGTKNKQLKLDGYKNYIKAEREKGRSKLSLANELNVTWLTLNTYCKLKKIK